MKASAINDDRVNVYNSKLLKLPIFVQLVFILLLPRVGFSGDPLLGKAGPGIAHEKSIEATESKDSLDQFFLARPAHWYGNMCLGEDELKGQASLVIPSDIKLKVGDQFYIIPHSGPIKGTVMKILRPCRAYTDASTAQLRADREIDWDNGDALLAVRADNFFPKRVGSVKTVSKSSSKRNKKEEAVYQKWIGSNIAKNKGDSIKIDRIERVIPPNTKKIYDYVLVSQTQFGKVYQDERDEEYMIFLFVKEKGEMPSLLMQGESLPVIQGITDNNGDGIYEVLVYDTEGQGISWEMRLFDGNAFSTHKQVLYYNEGH